MLYSSLLNEVQALMTVSAAFYCMFLLAPPPLLRESTSNRTILKLEAYKILIFQLSKPQPSNFMSVGGSPCNKPNCFLTTSLGLPSAGITGYCTICKSNPSYAWRVCSSVLDFPSRDTCMVCLYKTSKASVCLMGFLAVTCHKCCRDLQLGNIVSLPLLDRRFSDHSVSETLFCCISLQFSFTNHQMCISLLCLAHWAKMWDTKCMQIKKKKRAKSDHRRHIPIDGIVENALFRRSQQKSYLGHWDKKKKIILVLQHSFPSRSWS